MSVGSVVFVNSVQCPSCGLRTSAYMQVAEGGKGRAACPRCGTVIVQDVPVGSVMQHPPHGFVEPGLTVARPSSYAWLYARSKERPRLCLREVLGIALSPTKAFTRIFTCSDLGHALVVVLVFAILSNVVSVLVTESMADVIGYSASDALGVILQGAAGVVVAILSFLVFGVVAAMAAHEVFGGRGDKGSTLTLVAYCYPWFVLLTVVLLTIFTVGFEGLDLDRVQRWTDSETQRAIVSGAAMLAVALVGFVWLVWSVAKAVGMANDLRTSSAALCAVLAAVAAGIVSLLVGVFIQLPIGINF